MEDKVSVIIPAYNVEDYIGECIESINNQTYSNYEVIIVNDGSTDKTIDIIKQYQEKYEWIKVIDIENSGQGYARNIALKEAVGKYILFLDADDFLEPITLQLAIDRIKKDKSDFVVFDWKYYSQKTGNYRYVNKDKFFNKAILENDQCLVLLRIKHYFTVNKLYSKEFLMENDIKYGERYIYEDVPFWTKVCVCAKKVSLIHSPLYNVRINRTSTTKTNHNTDKHYIGFIKAASDSIKILKENYKADNNGDYYYLYNYLMGKFNVYYKIRIPRRLKRKFVFEFVNIMSNAIELTDLNIKNSLIRAGFKYNIFHRIRYVVRIL